MNNCFYNEATENWKTATENLNCRELYVMQSYSSAIDGKTLIRVGGEQTSQMLTGSSSAALHVGKSDSILTVTSSRRPSVTSSMPPRRCNGTSASQVTITSPAMSTGDALVPRTSSNSSITVKTNTPAKMTSIIDIKTGHVTSSVASPERKIASAALTSLESSAMLASSPSSTSLISYGPETPTIGARSTLSNWTSPSSPKATSVLMTSDIPTVSLNSGAGSTLTTSKATSVIATDVTSYPTMMSLLPEKSSAQHKSSSIVIPVNPAASVGVVVVEAEVHPPPKHLPMHSESLEDESTPSPCDRDPIGLPGSGSASDVEDRMESYLSMRSANDKDELGSLIYPNEADSTLLSCNPIIEEEADAVISQIPVAMENEMTLCPHSTLLTPLSPTSDMPLNSFSRIPGATESLPENSASSCTGRLEPETETKPASTFSFIGWEVASLAKKISDKICHRILIYKDNEIVLMFKASCTSDRVGDDRRLHALMSDIAFNCAQRLQKMKEITLPKLQAEHIDTLPLTDGRSAKEHIDDLSRELNEDVTINDIAYRYQSKQDSFIGTYVDEKIDLQARDDCEIGRAGVIVVLAKKSRFATVDAFSDLLCRHIISIRPTCLGRLSDLDLRELNQRRANAGAEQLHQNQLLFQDFLSDTSIIVAEAARRSFLRIEDFLLFC